MDYKFSIHFRLSGGIARYYVSQVNG